MLRSRRSQTGAATLELLIAMAVTGAIMGALVGVVYVANGAVAHWQQPLDSAASVPMIEILATAVESDARVFQPCQVSSAEVDFGDGTCQVPYAVRYVLNGNDVVRISPSGSAGITHRLAIRPAFAYTCQVQDAVRVGTISLSNLQYRTRLPDMVVRYSGPAGLC